ncbi:hypothetical protein [Roseateles sp.]|uniref:hypothetical protein n=1 Tax=Roseateles sp. TaxID=1971397 RepID=UPI002F3E1E52
MSVVLLEKIASSSVLTAIEEGMEEGATLISAYVENSRSAWLTTKFPVAKRLHRIALLDQPAVRQAVLANFRSQNPTATLCSRLEAEVELVRLAELGKKSGAPYFSILIDVSCMSRSQMGYVMAKIKSIAIDILPAKVRLLYCLAKFVPPPEQRISYNRRVAPVHQAFSGWTTSPGLPLEVIVSLGYERGKAAGAVEYLEPSGRWVFVPRSPEENYLKHVEIHNKELLGDRNKKFRIDYDVLDPVATYYSLLSLTKGLAQSSRPVLLPFGPKLFFALSLLVAACVEEAAVWHVDADEDATLATESSHSAVFECMMLSPLV